MSVTGIASHTMEKICTPESFDNTKLGQKKKVDKIYSPVCVVLSKEKIMFNRTFENL